MGSFREEDLSNGIDAAAGGLVWVCRRNGAWWPGKILGLDELPEDCTPTTAKVGVPVKLLGREDASVDWYNVEKSKRIKPFRCGEFDYCIEKAKESRASGYQHPKRLVKYARREDAINEALEIENARLLDDHPDAHNSESPSSLFASGDTDEELGGPEDDSESAPEVSHSFVSFGGINRKSAIKEKVKSRKTPNDSDDDDDDEEYGGVKRMRGIEDLGMAVGSTPKRKRSLVAKFPEYSKRKDRIRTLTNVLESKAMVFGPTGSNFPDRKKESDESKKNNSVVLNLSDSTGVSYDIATSAKATNLGIPRKEQGISSMFEVPIVNERNKSDVESSESSDVKNKSLGSEEENRSESTSSDTADIPNMKYRTEKGSSEWQLKGKRNSRARRMDDEAEIYAADTDQDGQNIVVKEVNSSRVKTRPMSEIQLEGWSWKKLPLHRTLPHHRHSGNPKADLSLRPHTKKITDSSGLFDVTVEVRTRQRPQQVPYISLMSKLSGRPVIGHPIQIEVVEYGYSDELINLPKGYSSSNSEFEQSGSDFRGVGMINKRRVHGKQGISKKNRSLKVRGSRKKSIKSKSRRNGGPLSGKIRKLSSLAGLCRENEEKEKPFMEKLQSHPVIACIPLKVVFSRINCGFNNTLRIIPTLTSKGNV